MRRRRRVFGLLVFVCFLLSCGERGTAPSWQVDRPNARVRAQASVTVPLRPGWNGLAFAGPLTSLTVPPGVVGYAHWNGTEYETGSLTVAEVNAGEGARRGFWAFANSPTNLSYQTDDSRRLFGLELHSGWNQVAFPAPSPIPGGLLEARRAGARVALASVVLPQFSEIQEDRSYRQVDLSSGGVLTPGKAYWVFASGNATLSWSPSVGNVTGQAGANATVRLSGSNLTTTADAQGQFTLGNVPAGPQTLQIGIQSRPVTVVARATVRLGGERLTRQQALDLVRARLGPVGATGRVVFASQNLLPTGTLVSEQPLSLDDGQTIEDRAPLTCGAPSWLFYADVQPTAEFDHSVFHILVEDATGQVQVVSKRRWPAVNGYPLWSRVSEWSGPDAIALEFGSPSASPAPTVVPRVSVSAGSKRYAIYVVMNHERLPSATYVNASFQPDMARFINAENLTVPGVEVNARIKKQQLVPVFEKAYNDACAALLPLIEEGDLLLVYVYGHGGFKETALGNASARAVYLQTPQYEIEVPEGQANPDGIVGPCLRLADRLTLPLKGLKACKLVFLIESCYSGGFVDPSGTVDPSTGKAVPDIQLLPPQIEANLPKKTDVLVLTSANSTVPSEGTGEFPAAPASKQTGIFSIELFDPASFVKVTKDKPTTLGNVSGTPPVATLRTYDDFKKSYEFLLSTPTKYSRSQDPKMYERKGDGSCKCLGLVPGSLRYEHTIRVTPLPQAVGTFAVTNNDEMSELVRASTSAAYLRVSPASAMVAPGATATFTVSFTGTGVSGPGRLSTTVRFDCPDDFVEGLVDGDIVDSVVLRTGR